MSIFLLPSNIEGPEAWAFRLILNYTTSSKQNITRNIETKNKLTVTTGEVGWDNRGNWGRSFRNIYKGHMDKAKAG